MNREEFHIHPVTKRVVEQFHQSYRDFAETGAEDPADELIWLVKGLSDNQKGRVIVDLLVLLFDAHYSVVDKEIHHD